MDLAPYVDDLRNQLLVAAEAGGDEARAIAERLTASLESTVRLVLLDALSGAASEITSELAPGSVDVRLRGRNPEFVVTAPPGDQSFPAATDATAAPTRPAAPTAATDTEEGGTARLTLRLGEQLKVRIEAAASADQVSVNAWLVRLAGAALDPRGTGPARPAPSTPPSSGQRFTGWAR